MHKHNKFAVSIEVAAETLGLRKEDEYYVGDCPNCLGRQTFALTEGHKVDIADMCLSEDCDNTKRIIALRKLGLLVKKRHG